MGQACLQFRLAKPNGKEISIVTRQAGSDIRVAASARWYPMTLDRISAESVDTAIVAPLSRIAVAETPTHLTHRPSKDVCIGLDTTCDGTKIACTPGTPENVYRPACRSKLPVDYDRLRYPSTLPWEPGGDTARARKIDVLREYSGDAIGRAPVRPPFRTASRRRPHTWLDALWHNERAVAFYITFGVVADGDGTCTTGAQRFIFRLMARPLP